MLCYSLALGVTVQCDKEQKFTQIKGELGQVQGMENHR